MSLQYDQLPIDARNPEYRSLLLSKGFRWLTVERRCAPGQFASMHKTVEQAQKAAQTAKRVVVDLETNDFG